MAEMMPRVKVKPFYFIASAKRRSKGLHAEAIAEVRDQLEKFPGDTAGMMLLATIQAEDLHDLPAAEATINELLSEPELTAQETATALHTLADWQLQVGPEPEAARVSLERIGLTFPDSQFFHAADQRIAPFGRCRCELATFAKTPDLKFAWAREDIGLSPAPRAEPVG